MLLYTETLKALLHLAENTNLKQDDKFAKISSFYELLNDRFMSDFNMILSYIWIKLCFLFRQSIQLRRIEIRN